MKPAKNIFRLLGGKIKFELALQPSTASTAKIQIQFSRQGSFVNFFYVAGTPSNFYVKAYVFMKPAKNL